MKKKKNEAFRLKNIKGARIEDAIFYLKEQIEELEDVYHSLPEEKQIAARAKIATLEELVNYFTIKFDYKDLDREII